MKFQTNFLLVLSAFILFLSGCAKEVEEYNRPAVYWYGKIIASVSDENLEKADDYYASLQGEHIGSVLLPEATMILALAHMENEEYLLSSHFLGEYIKRYADDNEREFAEYLKVKAKYLSLPNPRRDQVLIKNAIIVAKNFKIKYPHSEYYALVESMLTQLELAQVSLNESIALLYDRVDKHKSAEYYRAIQTESWIDWSEVEKADIPWYREMFEGDGTASWYAFLIPDTQSVVSRNSVQDDNETK